MEQFTKEELALISEALFRAARRQASEAREKGISALSAERHTAKAVAFSILSVKVNHYLAGN